MTRQRILFFMIIALCGAGCDQGSKWAAVEALTEVDDLAGFLRVAHPAVERVVTIHPDYFHLRYAENRGMAFSLLHDAPNARALLTFGGGVGLLLMLWLAQQTRDRWALCGWALIFGGGLGNLLDRARLGYVIDFVSWHYREQFVWPTFNVADALVFVGACLLFLRWQHVQPARPLRLRADG